MQSLLLLRRRRWGKKRRERVKLQGATLLRMTAATTAMVVRKKAWAGYEVRYMWLS
jgi:hypothetical protein